MYGVAPRNVQHQFPHSYNELIAPFFVSDDELKIPPGLDRDVAMVPSEKPIRPLPRGEALSMCCVLCRCLVELTGSGLCGWVGEGAELVQTSLKYTPSKIDPVALHAQKRAQLEAQQKAKPKPKVRWHAKRNGSTRLRV